MATFMLGDVAIYAGQANLSGWSNQVELTTETDVLDATTFSSNLFKQSAAGMRHVSSTLSGFMEAGGSGYPDDRIFADVGAASSPLTIAPVGHADGSLAYFFRAARTSYQWGGQVGEMAAFSGSAEGDGQPLVRGRIMLPNTSAKTASGTGSIVQLGAVSATQKLYAALHVFSVTGTTPSLTAIVQSDNAIGFASPVTALSFAAQTTVGSQFVSAPGPITDDWYRVSFTITGTGPNFVAAIVVGIA